MKNYLGDSVYVDTDGYYIILTTEQGDNVPSNRILLDSMVIANLKLWIEEHKNQSNEADERNP